jgi:valyl-tRNA synthetase
MPHDLPKAYEPSAIEARWAEFWIQNELFHVSSPAEGSPSMFSLLLPPPNVTGRLHMGHMLNHTQMDIVVRWHRMRGDLTLWLPGTDHAGIATQMMVERQLASEGKKRRELGREAFIERVWEWKKHYGGVILDQMKRLGDSVDWDREYFTMDTNLSRAVRETFVRLYEDGLIYRGKYIVNWCPRCGTAISDLEVKHEEVAGKLYEIRYPVVESVAEESALRASGRTNASVPTQVHTQVPTYITVATTRPETMLGDTAVAVNPKDERYFALHGKSVRLPLVGREIPIITDELAQPEFGTGAVKVTPSHDPNDFAAGLRHKLPQIDVIDEHGRMNENAGKYAGLDRFEARQQVVADLEEQGFLVGIKDYTISIGKCDRCKTIVEPRLSEQWFVKVEPLAKRAIEVVEKGYIGFTPANYTQIYLNWMHNIHDWCISRQLWWGHRIPAWRCGDCGEMIVARETPAGCTKCGGARLEQDSDVLDTWFSSGLLPFTTLGWPNATRDLEVFYPTSLLITGFDILFFWVARMIMLGCWFMMPPHRPLREGEEALPYEEALPRSVPFKDVYIHALVRDAERQKMSKTKGNVLDPIEVIAKYGTDATRFTLAAMSSPGTDIAFNPSRTEGYRAFANKIWNAARFMFMNVDRIGVSVRPEFGAEGVAGFEAVTLEDRWILSRFNQVAGAVDEALKAYRFDDAARAIYDFFWGEFCDWYIELVKPRLDEGAPREAAEVACGNLVRLFEASLRLLHPVMPFITEEIWHAIYDGEPPVKSLALAAYPSAAQQQMDLGAETEMAILQDLIVSVRNLRAELKVGQKEKVPAQVYAEDQAVVRLIQENLGAVERLAHVSGVTFVKESLAKLAGARHTSRFDVHVVYERPVDVAVEREKLRKELERIEKEMANGERQLGNEQFLAKAPAAVVEGIRKKMAESEVLREKTRSKLEELGSTADTVG